jgi:SpoVK/Ycf46/Vps4 family AAA+-type ATPase
LPEIEKKSDENTNQKITLSFLLNLFDGVLETPGRITFMTTNFLDKLDKAFTRPGRIDVIAKFGFADNSQLIAIIEHRYDTTLSPEQLNIVNNIPQCITPAEISRILFENFNNLDGALDSLVNYATECIQREQIKREKEAEINAKVMELETNATPNVSTQDTVIETQDTTQINALNQPKNNYKNYDSDINIEYNERQQKYKTTNNIAFAANDLEENGIIKKYGPVLNEMPSYWKNIPCELKQNDIDGFSGW